MKETLTIENLSVQFKLREGTLKVLRNIDLKIHQGEVVGLVGESGSGKSTLALAIMRYLGSNGLIASGKIFLSGENILQATEKEIRRIRGKKIALVYQNPETSLNPSLRIGEQIAETICLHEGIRRKDAWIKGADLLETTNIPNPAYVMRLYPHELSGGQQQRVVIAMALCCNPDLLILDEPTTALDVTTQAIILDLLENLRTNLNLAVLYITHDLGVIAKIAHRINVLYAGAIVEKGDTREVFKRPLHPYTRALLNCIPMPYRMGGKLHSIKGSLPRLSDIPRGCIFQTRCSFGSDECLKNDMGLSEVDKNHESACIMAAYVGESTFQLESGMEAKSSKKGMAAKRLQVEDVLISIRDLRVHYVKKSIVDALIRRTPARVKAVDGVSIDVKRGETIGIIGESGCGKTTLGECIVRLRNISDGRIYFKGKDVIDLRIPELRGFRQNVSIVFQNPDSSLNPKKKIGAILARPLELFGLVSRGIKKNLRVKELLEIVGLHDDYMNRYPHELSGGEKQRVAIARAISTQPELLICDEPTSFLDVSVQASIINLLMSLKEEMNMACLFITHNLSVAQHISNKMAVMYLGKIVEIGSTEQIFAPPYHPYTAALLSAIPVPDPDHKAESIRLEGPVPSAKNPPQGCRFHTRCPRKLGRVCEIEDPSYWDAGDGHKIWCHFSPLEGVMN